ncbi:hypothetical protein EON80_10265 [bacterium]|nr:MAG: hypothetical protein EON80_10265 [bacterium]
MFKRLGCLACLVVLGFFGFGVYRALYPPRVGGVAFSQLPPETQKERRADAQKLVEQVEDVARSARKKERKEFKLEVTEDQLNTLLQDRLRTEKFPIDDLRAGLSPGILTLQGTAKYQGFDVPATLNGTLEAKDDTLDFQIDSLSLSGLPAPGNIKEKAEKAISEGLKKAFRKDGSAKIEKVEIGEGKMMVEGRTG